MAFVGAPSPPRPRQPPQALFERCVAYDRRQRPCFREVLLALAPLVERAEEGAPPPASPGAGLGQLRSISFAVACDSPFAAAAGGSPFSSGSPRLAGVADAAEV